MRVINPCILVIVVLVGLAVGVAFVLLFAISQSPNLQPNDAQIIIASDKFPEAQVFWSQYPSGNVVVDRTGSYDTSPIVVYFYEKNYEDGRIDQSMMFVGMNTLTNMPHRDKISTVCNVTYDEPDSSGMGYWTMGMSVLEILQTTECAK